MRAARFALLTGLVPGLAIGQPSPSFEVASVRPVGEGRLGGVTGGPGSSDPGRITYEAVTMEVLIQAAFGLMPYQISGPSWMLKERYAVTAKLPPGTTQEQIPQMTANLLAERFGFVFRREMKDFPGYAIVVSKGGAKLRPTTHDDPLPVFRGADDGSGTMHYVITQTSMNVLANRISLMLRTAGPTTTPVVDHTGIAGKYDLTLDVPNRRMPGPTLEDLAIDISDALQRQAGLRLERTTVTLPTVIVDHVEQVPTPD